MKVGQIIDIIKHKDGAYFKTLGVSADYGDRTEVLGIAARQDIPNLVINPFMSQNVFRKQMALVECVLDGKVKWNCAKGEALQKIMSENDTVIILSEQAKKESVISEEEFRPFALISLNEGVITALYGAPEDVLPQDLNGELKVKNADQVKAYLLNKANQMHIQNVGTFSSKISERAEAGREM